jgi:OOP family OmpA-OmpF porin
VRLRIAGHTDAQGDRGSNRVLSLARANAVRSYLASRTVSPARLVAVGYGAERPLGPNRTPEGRRLNRRIEFTVERDGAR